MPSSSTENDRSKELIRRAREGEAEAVSELYRQHAPKIFRYFYLRLKDQAVAEDLTGEVFLRMVQSLPQYADSGAPIAAWLFRIAHDRLVDYHRQNRPVDELPEQLHDPQPGLEAQAVDASELRDVMRFVETLTEEQQLVVQLRFIEGLSVEETAQLLNKTPGAVKALQHRALRSLMEKLKP
jgi:RNA polymerase sigma-70 factor (ECF subfamily)